METLLFDLQRGRASAHCGIVKGTCQSVETHILRPSGLLLKLAWAGKGEGLGIGFCSTSARRSLPPFMADRQRRNIPPVCGFFLSFLSFLAARCGLCSCCSMVARRQRQVLARNLFSMQHWDWKFSDDKDNGDLSIVVVGTTAGSLAAPPSPP